MNKCLGDQVEPSVKWFEESIEEDKEPQGSEGWIRTQEVG